MTRSRLVAAAGLAASAVGLALGVAGAVAAASDDTALALVASGGVIALAGVVGLLVVVLVTLRRTAQNLSSVRAQAQRTGRRVERQDAAVSELTSQLERFRASDVDAVVEAALQRGVDEGRIELKALAESTMATSVQIRRTIETVYDGVRPSLEAHRVAASRLDEVIASLAHREEGTAEHVTAALRNEIRRTTSVGGDVQRLVRHESMALFGLLESLDRIHSQLDLRAPLPSFGDWAIRSDLGSLLVELVLSGGREGIVDLGSGLSTILLAAAARERGSGHVVSIDHLPEYAEATRRRLEQHGLGDWATVHHAPLASTEIRAGGTRWYDLRHVELPDTIDLLLVDGPPGDTGPMARQPAVPMLRDHFVDGTVILLDDADRPGEREVADRWMEELEGSDFQFLPHLVGTLRIDVVTRQQ